MGRKKTQDKTEQGDSLGGILGGLVAFLKGIEEMQEKSGQSDFTLPSGQKGRTAYHVKFGETERQFNFRPGRQPVHPRKVRGVETKEIRPGEPEKEFLIDIFDQEDHVLVVTELPKVRKEDLSFRIKDNILRITAKTKEGKVEKKITIPKESKISKIEDVTYKNNILTIKLKKKQ